jgi:acetyl-CoA acetyltransferase
MLRDAQIVMCASLRAPVGRIGGVSRRLTTAVRSVLRSWAISGCAPKLVGFGPVSATAAVPHRAGLTVDNSDLVEFAG